MNPWSRVHNRIFNLAIRWSFRPSKITSNKWSSLQENINSACWVIFHDFFCRLSTFFKIDWKNDFRNFFRVSNSLDPDQTRHLVGPNLGPNCLERSAANNKIPMWRPRRALQEVFHLYLNKFEKAITHLFPVIFGNNWFPWVSLISRNRQSSRKQFLIFIFWFETVSEDE